MRFEFGDLSGTQLRAIHELPDGGLVRLRGRNGIGKTLAMRLLALCAQEENPWIDEPRAWQTLREELPEGYTIKGTVNGTTVEWSLHPRADEWPQGFVARRNVDHERATVRREAPAPSTVPVRVTVDGEPVDEGPLDVYLLSGRESLLQVWARLIRRDEGRFRVLSDTASRRITAIREAFGRLQRASEAAHPKTVARAEERLELVRGRLKDSRDALDELRLRLGVQDDQQRLAKRLDEAESNLPGIETEIAETRSELTRLHAERDHLKQRIGQLLEGGGLSTRDLERYQRALRNEETRLEAHQRALKDLTRLLKDERLRDVAREDVENELSAVRARIRDLEREAQAIKREQPVLGLTRHLATVIDDHDDVAPSSLLLDSDDITATAEQTRAGLRGRISTLEEAGPLQRIESEIEELEETKAILKEVVDAEERLRRKSKLVAEIEEAQEQEQRVHDTLTELAREDERLQSTIERQQDRLVDLEKARSALLGGADDLNELRARVRSGAIAESSPVTRKDLDAQQEAVGTLTKEVQEAKEQLREAKAAATAGSVVLETYGLDPTDDHRPSLESVDAVIAELTDQLDVAEAAYRFLRQAIEDHNGSSERPPRALAGAARNLADFYAEQWEQRLSSGAFEEHLFGGGSFDSIDLLDGTFAWTDPSGTQHRRAIQALSSGQMVYAYTKAVLADLSEPSPDRFRLIVLDEFAAYLDQEAQRKLVGDLQKYVERNDRTQVVMVLPEDPPDSKDGYVAEVVA